MGYSSFPEKGQIGKARFVRFAAGLAVLLAIAAAPGIFSQGATSSPDGGSELDGILNNTRAYCRKLDEFAFYFVCREEVTENLRMERNVRWTVPPNPADARDTGTKTTLSVSRRTVKTTFLYDYQLIRRRDNSLEERTLIGKNGRPMNVPNANLEAMRFFFQNFAFGPVDLFGEAGRSRHEYRISGREKFKGEKAIVVEARSTGNPSEYNPGGKVWVREGDNAILKIEWDQTTLKGFEDIKAAADRYQAIPQFKIVTEYGVEKNGIRFPSHVLIREAYLRTRSRRIQKASEVTIDYKDYKFFQVEVETK